MFKKYLVVYHITFAVILAPALTTAAPVAEKNHSPVFIGFLYPSFESAGTVPSGKGRFDTSFDYSSIFYKSVRNDWFLFTDMEFTQLTFTYRYGLADGLEVGISQPVYHAGGGFLDQFIIDWHDAFGLPNYPGQREAPRNRYLYIVWHDGVFWNTPTANQATLGDTTAWLKKELFNANDFVVSTQFLAQAPTANSQTAFGNGVWEYGLLVALDKKIDRTELFANTGWIRTGSINRGEKLNTNPITFFKAGGTFNVTGRFSVTIQSGYATAPYLENNWIDFTVGISYTNTNGTKFTVSFLEDLSQTAPDFTGQLSMEVPLGK